MDTCITLSVQAEPSYTYWNSKCFINSPVKAEPSYIYIETRQVFHQLSIVSSKQLGSLVHIRCTSKVDTFYYKWKLNFHSYVCFKGWTLPLHQEKVNRGQLLARLKSQSQIQIILLIVIVFPSPMQSHFINALGFLMYGAVHSHLTGCPEKNKSWSKKFAVNGLR